MIGDCICIQQLSGCSTHTFLIIESDSAIVKRFGINESDDEFSRIQVKTQTSGFHMPALSAAASDMTGHYPCRERVMPQPDLSVLSGCIRKLPPSQWQERMLFSGAPDLYLREQTGSFPATFRSGNSTHPIFVLRLRVAGNLVCPCSSSGSKRRQRYIRKNCCLELSGWTTDRDSFLVEQYHFTVPLDGRFARHLMFRGLVPSTCLAGGEHRS